MTLDQKPPRNGGRNGILALGDQSSAVPAQFFPDFRLKQA